MLGGSEDDLCRPTRSKEPGFQLLDAEDWLSPPRLDIWTEGESQRRRGDYEEGRARENALHFARTSVHFTSNFYLSESDTS